MIRSYMGTRWTQALVLFIFTFGLGGVPATQGQGTPDSIVLGNTTYLFFTNPRSFLDAVSACQQQSDAANGTLLSVGRLVPLLHQLHLADRQRLQELLSRLSAARTASAAQLPPQQEAAWDLWAWDQQRACRAVDAAPRPPGSSPQTGPTLVAQDVPCNWQLGFVCVQQEEEQVVGTSPSSASATAWYLRHRDALALPAASPHVGGPGGSGLELAVSGQVAGMVQPPGVVTVAFDDSQRFWEQGPVVSFLFRGDPSVSLYIRPVRRYEPVDPWVTVVRNYTPPTGVTSPEPQWQLYTWLPTDYVNSVQVCHSFDGVASILYTTALGFSYLIGAHACDTDWLREDAPPGGYLAGVATVETDFRLLFWDASRTRWSFRPEVRTSTSSAPTTKQLRLVWAGPADNPTPTLELRTPAKVAPESTCPQAWPVAVPDFTPGETVYVALCGPSLQTVCRSSTCCGASTSEAMPANVTAAVGAGSLVPVFSSAGPAPSPRAIYVCTGDALACRAICAKGWGMCGDQPGAWGMVFSRNSQSGGGDSELFLVRRSVDLTYQDAVSSCRSGGWLGLSWTHATTDDFLAVTSSLDTPAILMYGFRDTNMRGWWVNPSTQPTNAADGDAACLVATYMKPYDKDAAPHTFSPTPCSLRAIAFCKTTVRQLTSGSGGGSSSSSNSSSSNGNSSSNSSGGSGSSGGGGSGSAEGDVDLRIEAYSVGFGAGPFGAASCPFSLGPYPSAQPGDVVQVTQHNTITAFSVSRAAVVPNAVPRYALNYMLAGMKIQLGSNSTQEPVPPGEQDSAAASTASPGVLREQVAGAASSDGWLTLQLGSGEVVTGVGGCAGGFLERLVLHTDSGRQWTAPWTGQSPCSTPFYVAAPPGGRLVGVQGYMGRYFVEQLRFVWGSPLDQGGGIGGPAPGVGGDGAGPDLGQPRPLGGTADGGSAGSSAVVVGAAVGGAAGGFVAVAVLLAVLWRRRSRRRADRAAAAAAAAAAVAVDVKVAGGEGEGAAHGAAGASGGPGAGAAVGAAGPGSGVAQRTGMVVVDVAAGKLQGTMAGVGQVGAKGLVHYTTSSHSHGVSSLTGYSTGATGHMFTGYTSASSAAPYSRVSGGAAAPGGPNSAASGSDVGLGVGVGTGTGVGVGGGDASSAFSQQQALSTVSVAAMESRLSQYRYTCVRAFPASPNVTGASLGSGAVASLPSEHGSQQESAAARSQEAAAAAAAAAAGPAAAEAADPLGVRAVAAAVQTLQVDMATRQQAQPSQLRILGELGRGAYGVVHRGTWRGLSVAVKVLLVNDAAAGREAQRRHRALLEAALASSLHHPHVVTTYSYHIQQLAVVGAAAADQAGGTALSPGIDQKAAVLPEEGAAARADDGGAPEAGAASGGGVPAGLGQDSVYKLYIIQEYCDMGSLKDALRSGAVGYVLGGGASSLCALSLALDVACGMAHIHAKHIVHGDLSAGNVLLASGPPAPASGPCSPEDALVARSLAGCWRPSVVAKVADFGLSVALGEGQTHASRRFQGTPAYTAPEVLTRGLLSKAADVYSYGVLLLELTYGTMPPHGPVGATEGRGLADVTLPASCPPAVAALIRSCTAADRAQRPTFGQVVSLLVQLLAQLHEQLRGSAAAFGAGGSPAVGTLTADTA